MFTLWHSRMALREFFTSSDQRFRVKLENRLDHETLVHWHGQTPPSEQDGTPGLSQPPLQPNSSHDYDFALRPGTHWMHSHVGLQKQKLFAAPLIVRDAAEAKSDEQEIVVLLQDFSFMEPEEIFARLTGKEMGTHSMSGNGDGEMSAEPTGMSQADQANEHSSHAEGGHGDGGAPMIHYNDFDFDAYLANNRTLADPEIVRVDSGSQVRLRIINGASATNFQLDLRPLQGTLIAVDGNPVQPVRGYSFPLAMAQRADIRLDIPDGEGAYPIFAQREDDTIRTGVILATKNASVIKVEERVSRKAMPLGSAFEEGLEPLGSTSPPPLERFLSLALTGNHKGYDWTLNNEAFDPKKPLFVRHGDFVEVKFENKTVMSHPMHLHGHHFQVVGIGDKRVLGAIRDTLLVPAGEAMTISFKANNRGHWAFHCHHLYHMAAGMMTSVRYAL